MLLFFLPFLRVLMKVSIEGPKREVSFELSCSFSFASSMISLIYTQELHCSKTGIKSSCVDSESVSMFLSKYLPKFEECQFKKCFAMLFLVNLIELL